MSNFCPQDVENKDKSFDVVKFGNNFSRPGQILILISIFSKCERTRNRVNVQSSITNSTFILYVIRSIKTRHSCRSQQAPGYHNEEMTSLTTEKVVKHNEITQIEESMDYSIREKNSQRTKKKNATWFSYWNNHTVSYTTDIAKYKDSSHCTQYLNMQTSHFFFFTDAQMSKYS